MPGATAKFGWPTPLGADLANTLDTTLTSSLDSIDAGVAPIPAVGLFGNRPAASAANAGKWYVATDALGGTAYLSDGSTWIQGGASVLKTIAKKALGTSRASTTVLAADPDLTLPIVVGKFYDFFAFVVVNGAAAADLKFLWAVPTGAVGRFQCVRMMTTAATVDDFARAGKQIATGVEEYAGTSGTGAANQVPLIFRGFVYNPATGGTAGNITFQWAQNTADATNTTVAVNSYMTLDHLGSA